MGYDEPKSLMMNFDEILHHLDPDPFEGTDDGRCKMLLWSPHHVGRSDCVFGLVLEDE